MLQRNAACGIKAAVLRQALPCCNWRQRRRQLKPSNSPPASAAAEAAGTTTANPQSVACGQLMTATGTVTSLVMRPAKHQNGIFTTKPVSRGEIIMAVPKRHCLIVDYSTGLSLPSAGSWPRLKEALATDETMNWDLLLALALLDGLAGDGGSFWQAYCEAILPAPETLTLPMCWSRERLEWLQHADIANAALQQQQRLAAMFPDLTEPAGEDAPSWMQWAFACVRSRAYKVGDDAFAMVPFWDLSNHDVQPNTAFRADPSGWMQLIVLKDLGADEEVLISYTGEEGYTNQRLMAQYGFVLPGGNPADRVPFQMPIDSKCRGLSLERIQGLMGDADFINSISAKNIYGYAALKSLPLADENQAGTIQGDIELANVLLQQCLSLEAGASTSLQEDEKRLLQLRGHSQQLASAVPGPGLQKWDEREASAIEYRVERKRLLRVCKGILKLYVSGQESLT